MSAIREEHLATSRVFCEEDSNFIRMPERSLALQFFSPARQFRDVNVAGKCDMEVSDASPGFSIVACTEITKSVCSYFSVRGHREGIDRR